MVNLSPALNGRRCIVSLTYDDGLPCHPEFVAPLLERHGLRATFYPHLLSRFWEQLARWRRMAQSGHELGNHTLFHPCYDERWPDRPYNLKNYTVGRWRDEVALANHVLHAIDGHVTRTFGNTCHHNLIGSGETQVQVAAQAPDFFVACRGEHTRRPVNLEHINWFNLGTKGVDGATFASLREEVEMLCETGGWIIYTLHGVGSRDIDLHIDEHEHRLFVEWLGQHHTQIWTAPVADVVRACAPPHAGSLRHEPSRKSMAE